MRSILVASRKGVQGSSSSEWETSDTEQDWHLSLGDGNEVGGNDVGHDVNPTGNHVVQDRLEGVETETRDDEGSESRYTSRDERNAEYANDIHPLLGVEQALSDLAPVKV